MSVSTKRPLTTSMTARGENAPGTHKANTAVRGAGHDGPQEGRARGRTLGGLGSGSRQVGGLGVDG